MTSPPQSLKDKLTPGERARLSGLLKTAQAELLHLQQTDQRLFDGARRHRSCRNFAYGLARSTRPCGHVGEDG